MIAEMIEFIFGLSDFENIQDERRKMFVEILEEVFDEWNV